jgi:hypothetical protein
MQYVQLRLGVDGMTCVMLSRDVWLSCTSQDCTTM